MNPLFTTGVTFGWILASLGLAAIFGVAYVTRRREPEHLVFSVLSLAITVHAWSIDVALDEPGGSPLWQAGTVIGFTAVLVVVALLLHFALLFGGIRNRRIIWGLYAGTAIASAFTYPDGALKTDAVGSVLHHSLGISIACTKSALLPMTRVVGSIAAMGALFSVALLARAYLRGRRDGLAACLGAAVFALTLAHDYLVLENVLSRGPWLTPTGFLAFAFGVGCSLLIRHAVLGKELERRTLELERSYAHLRATQAELVRKRQLAAVGELAAVIAHEVRNPLAIIMNAVTGLHRHDLDQADETMLLDILDEESRRLNRLVSDLLRYARPVQLNRQPIDIDNVIARALHVLKTNDEIEVSVEPIDGLGSIYGDPDLLRIVFGNLIDNAVQAMDEGGKLRIRFHREAHGETTGIGIAIEDTGSGMTADVKQRATDPFFTTRPSGTGLGLAIVDRIVQAHGGEVSIESEPGRGTTVHVFLPSNPVLHGVDELVPNSGPGSSPFPILEAI